MERVTAYVDGFNLYFGMHQAGLRRYFWLDVYALAANLIKPSQTLVQVNYSTARISGPPDKQSRQKDHVEALQTQCSNFEMQEGRYTSEVRRCRNCGHQYVVLNEKMTDVNIACTVMSDAHTDAFDVALLISADSDLTAPITKTQQLFPQKRVIVAFPPQRSSKRLKQVAAGYIHVSEAALRRSQLFDVILKPNGVTLSRPTSWR